jgi:hypothetical protein
MVGRDTGVVHDGCVRRESKTVSVRLVSYGLSMLAHRTFTCCFRLKSSPPGLRILCQSRDRRSVDSTKRRSPTMVQCRYDCVMFDYSPVLSFKRARPSNFTNATSLRSTSPSSSRVLSTISALKIHRECIIGRQNNRYPFTGVSQASLSESVQIGASERRMSTQSRDSAQLLARCGAVGATHVVELYCWRDLT